jgi:hypothetical protein
MAVVDFLLDLLLALSSIGITMLLRLLIWIPGSYGGGIVLIAATATATVTLLSQQHTTNTLVNGFQMGKVGRGNLDGVAGNWKNHDVLPRVKLILVFDHLRSLPVVLNAGTLQ